MEQDFKVIWAGSAVQDPESIIAYIAEDSPAHARKILSKIKKKQYLTSITLRIVVASYQSCKVKESYYIENWLLLPGGLCTGFQKILNWDCQFSILGKISKISY